MKNKAAQLLGRMGKGRPKNYSAEELERRRERMRENQKKRWPNKSKTKEDFN